MNTARIRALLLAGLALSLLGCTKGLHTGAPSAVSVKGAGFPEPIPAVGSPDAAVRLTFVLNYRCTHCARQMAMLDHLAAEKADTMAHVQIVFRSFAFPMGGAEQPEIARAHAAALAAQRQKAFLPYHKHLLAHQSDEWSAETLIKYAVELGLDEKQFKEDLAHPAPIEHVRIDTKAAKRAGITGTPALFVNAERVAAGLDARALGVLLEKKVGEIRGQLDSGSIAEPMDAWTRTTAATNGSRRHARVVRYYLELDGTELLFSADEPGAAKPPRLGAGPLDPRPGTSPTGRSPTLGPSDAPVTIVMSTDFQCPFCSRVAPALEQIRARWPEEVRILFVNNPLSFHKRALPAAVAALAAHRQGRFWPLHNKLFANQRALGDSDLERYAREVGVDITRWQADRQDVALRRQVLNEQRAAVALGLGGTPGFLINGRKLSGAQPFAGFEKIIEAELDATAKLRASGVAPEAIHERRVRANLASKADVYWNSLVLGRPAPRQKRTFSDVVWKVELSGHEPTLGPKHALVTLVIFTEFQCPFCSRFAPTVEAIAKKYPEDVRIVFKHNPLPFHKRALPAAYAAIAAKKQGKFWELAQELFRGQRDLSDEALERYARKVGIKIRPWKKAMKSKRTAAVVKKDQARARLIRARGTPNTYVNGRQARGALKLEAMSELIDEELAKARKLVQSGTKPRNVYAVTIAKGQLHEVLDAKVHSLSTKGRPFLGAARGDIVMTVFVDFQCPYCARVPAKVKKLLADRKLKRRLKVVYKHFPLNFHKQARNAAAAVIAAGKQGKFWKMASRVYANMKSLSPTMLRDNAKAIGLNLKAYDAYLSSGKAKAIIEADMAEARKAGLRGTPTIYINGRKLNDFQLEPAAMRAMVRRFFRKKRR